MCDVRISGKMAYSYGSLPPRGEGEGGGVPLGRCDHMCHDGPAEHPPF